MKRIAVLALLATTTITCPVVAQSLKINDLGYFEDRGINYLVYSNNYNGMFCDEKTAAIEIIQRGVRIATGGGIRLMNTPEQWDIYPKLTDRKVDTSSQEIAVVLDYAEYKYDFKPVVKVQAKDKGVTMAVYLDKPLPEELAGKAGMNIEFFPATYFGKTFSMDGKPDILPRHPASETTMHPWSEKITQIYGDHLSTFDNRGRDEFIVASPIATGHKLVLAPEDKNLRVAFASDSEINLYDGRNLSSNGTFVVRTFLPKGKTGKVAEWYIESSYDPDWVREPNIGFSQVGYTPNQKKVSVVELDKNDQLPSEASIIRYNEDGTEEVVLKPAVSEWGVYNNRYNYATIDFSGVDRPGVYCIEYKGRRTNSFPISDDVYANIWKTTMDVWLPVQMDHMEVKEGYRIWHGRSNMDDALQAPTNWSQHDGYRQGPETFTKYKPWEHIPNLAVGAWYDAGDFDIQGGTVTGVTSGFTQLWDLFGLKHDQTFIDQKTQFVGLHRPDGTPDVLQQIEHGALNVCAQVENIGFVAQGIVQVNMWQYVHIGDGVTQTDGLLYNPSLRPYETYGQTSGTRDDRVAFTNNYSPLDAISAVSSLAAAARTLKDYNPELSARCLKNALMLWDKHYDAVISQREQATRMRRGVEYGLLNPAIELWRTTGEEKYKDIFMPLIMQELQPVAEVKMDKSGNPLMAMHAEELLTSSNLVHAIKVYPYITDKKFRDAVKNGVRGYVARAKKLAESNPYGVPVTGHGWGGTEMVLNWAYNNYLIWRYFPDMIDKDLIFNGMHFIFGRHPYSNVSFVNSVGVNAKKVAYGNNRGDYTVIPGGIAPGLLLMNPDFMEHKDDYPFLWGENECCTRNVPNFVMFCLGCEEMTKSDR